MPDVTMYIPEEKEPPIGDERSAAEVQALMEANTNPAKTRVQVDFGPNEIARMNFLMAVCRLETRKELFNNALTLFEWAVNEIRANRSIGAVDRAHNQFTMLSMPALAAAATPSEKYVRIAELAQNAADATILPDTPQPDLSPSPRLARRR